MPEGETPVAVFKARRESAAKIVESKKKLLKGKPFAEFNLNTTGRNPEVTFDSIPSDIAEPPLTDRLKGELANPRFMEDPKTGQKLKTLVLNEHISIDAGPVTLFIPAINNDITQSPNDPMFNYTHYKIQELARYLPDSQLIAFDYPSVGESDPMTSEQVKAFKNGHGFEEIARMQLRILQQMGVKELNVVAQSLGAFTGAHLAKLAEVEFGIKVANAVLTETPGILYSNRASMFLRRLMPESKFFGLYHSAPFDPTTSELSPLAQLKRDLKWTLTGMTKGKGLLYGKEVSQPTLEPTLSEALVNNPSMNLTLINGSESRVAPKKEMGGIMERFKSGRFSDRVREIMFPGESHVVMEQAKRNAWMTRYALRGSKPKA